MNLLNSQAKVSFFIAITIALLFISFALLGLQLSVATNNISPLWPATGVAIASLLLAGYRYWPAIALGSFCASLLNGNTLPASLLIGTGSAVEALLAAYAIRQFCSALVLDEIASLLRFIGILVISCLAGSAIGLSGLVVGGVFTVSQFAELWPTWWLGDFIGGLLIVPLMLTLVSQQHLAPAMQRRWEFLLMCTSTTILGLITFDNLLIQVPKHSPLAFLPLPLMLWATMRFQVTGAIASNSLLAMVSLWGTSRGNGPFALPSSTDSLIMLQEFNCLLGSTALLLAATFSERKRAHSALTQTQLNLERIVDSRTAEIQRSNKHLENEIKQTRSSSNALSALLTATSASNSDDFFKQCVKNLADIYQVRYAFIGVFNNECKDQVKTIAVWAGDDWAENFCYELKHTPCQDVINLEMEIIPRGAAQIYAKDQMLVDMAIDSYFGSPLIAQDNTMIGLVTVMDVKPLELQAWVKPVLGIFANRIALEMERKEAEEELKLAASVFQESIEAVMISNANNQILRVNPAFTKITGYDSEEVSGKSPLLLRCDKNTESFYKEFWATIKATGFWQGELWHQHKDGRCIPVWQTVTAVSNKSDQPEQYISIFSDISEKKQSEERIYHLAHYDSLTGLANRAAFQDMLERELHHTQRAETGLALLYLDLDNFKLINDSAGHETGDQLLQHVAKRLEDSVRDNDTVCRLGGDEFAILLPLIKSPDEAAIVAKKILQRISGPILLDHKEILVSVSIGISTCPQDARDGASLLKNADVAMYQAKLNGRNNYQFFTRAMNERAQERANIEHDLRKALERDELQLFYQPQQSLHNQAISGFEALLRWHHPVRGMIPPSIFIPIAEECGLINAIGSWVLKRACQDCMRWQPWLTQPAKVSVNLSARQFIKQDIQQEVAQALQASQLPAELLELELTESVIMEDVEESTKALHSLRHLGVKLAVDDFGTGYSSMAYLKRFPLSSLKIDRSFIIDIADDSDDAAIVAATIALGHSLNLQVVAEGVESQQQLQMLKALGCDTIQGYYLHKPMPIDAIADFIKINANVQH